MILRQRAREIAKEFVDNIETYFKDDDYVIVEESIKEYDFGWIFFYESKKFIETGEISYALAGNGPLFVDKKGSILELESSKSFEVHERELKERFGNALNNK